jgi:hypothetical protein
MTHELVVFRAASASALPKVTKAGERSVGAINEEVVAETDKMGETGEVKSGSTVTKTFVLAPGTYVSSGRRADRDRATRPTPMYRVDALAVNRA